MIKYFSSILILLLVLPACKITQVSMPVCPSLENTEYEISHSASDEIQTLSSLRQPSGLSGRVGDESFSTNQMWVEEMITAPAEGNDGSQNVYCEGVNAGAMHNYTGPCVLVESEGSERWFANMRFLSHHGMGHALNTIHRRGSQSESAVTITPDLNPQDEEPDDREIPPSAVFGIILALFPVLSVFGIIFSLIALIRIDNHPDMYKGTGLAVAGLLLSVIMSVVYMAAAASAADAAVGGIMEALFIGIFGG